MQARNTLILLALATALSAQTVTVSGVKTGLRLVTARQRAARALAGQTGAAGKSLTPGRVYRVVQFDHVPGTEDLAALTAAGMVPLQYVPDNSVMVSMVEGRQQGVLASAAEESGQPTFELARKMSPLVDAQEDVDGQLTVVAEFFPDVAEGDMHAIAQREGLSILAHADLVEHQLLVKGTRAQVEALAGWEELSYVFPASKDLSEGALVHGCVGAVTAAGPVANYIAKVGEGWDGPGKGVANLRYTLAALSAQMPQDSQRAEILRALAAWSAVVQVNFSEGGTAGSTKHFNILFGKGAHGDAYAFDGRGKVLAHTFFPSLPNPEPIAGDMHFDDDEVWGIGVNMDLFSVALHELGHGLGLGHSDDPANVMYPYYRRWDALTAGDIAAVQELYAARTAETPAPTPTPAPAPAPAPTPAPTPTPAPAPTPTPTPTNPPAAPKVDTVKPAINISSPSSSNISTVASSITFTGTAMDNVGVAAVKWSSNVYMGANATGTAQWSATVPLAVGTNRIALTAVDAAGNIATRNVVVTRR
jgi:hypothetical protein